MTEQTLSKQSIQFINQINTLIPYENALMQIEAYKKQAPCIWFLQHPHMYSLGNRGLNSEIQNIYNLPIYESGRGGKVTYHGPGQLIVYCFFDLRKTQKTIHEYVTWLENIISETLAHFGIQSNAGPHPGIWVGDAKIASIGVRVQEHITSHGFALNVSNDIKYFKPIHVCGQAHSKVTSMSHFFEVDIRDVAQCVQNIFEQLTQ